MTRTTRTFRIPVVAPAATKLEVMVYGGTFGGTTYTAMNVGGWREFVGATSWSGGTLAFWETAGSNDGILDFPYERETWFASPG